LSIPDRISRLQEAFDLLREAHQKRSSSLVAALVEELLEKPGSGRGRSEPHGDQVAGNLRKALQMIRALEMERPLTLGAYVGG